jgi:hypothetical protein
MNVKVGNGLARLFAAIDDETVPPFLESDRPRRLHNGTHEMPPHFRVVTLRSGRNVFSGNHENMPGSDRVDVPKGNGPLVLANHLRRNRSSTDAAEEAHLVHFFSPLLL